MEEINKGSKWNAYFKGIKGEVHVVIEDKKYTFGGSADNSTNRK